MHHHVIQQIPHNIGFGYTVEIQTVALLAGLWTSYEHPARNKRANFLSEFPFTITPAMIQIYKTVTKS